jgi:hypothetical protein
MLTNEINSPRREFLGKLSATAAGLATLSSSFMLSAEPSPVLTDAEAWIKKIKGKHRVVFDATQPHDILPFAWPRVFLMTNEKTGTPATDCGVMVVLRHSAIPYAMEDRLWEKYHFGDVFKVEDPMTKAPAVRNPFWQPKPGDFKIPGVGNVAIGINELMNSGVMLCVCDMAMTVYSSAIAEQMKMDGAEIKKDWESGVLPGIQPVPSGVWALGRAQENGCSYIFAG